DADDLAEAGRRGGPIEAQDIIPRHGAVPAMAAVVVGPLQSDGPDQAGDGLGPITDESGRFVAGWAADAGPSVPPFFRSCRAGSMALAPILWTCSLTSNSV